MGNVSFAAASTQEDLTLCEDDVSENEFELTPKPREPGLKTTSLSNDESKETGKESYNL
jgi:hypothetical protein